MRDMDITSQSEHNKENKKLKIKKKKRMKKKASKSMKWFEENVLRCYISENAFITCAFLMGEV